MNDHTCNFCGGDADTGGSVKLAIEYGGDNETKRFYCDQFCAAVGEASLVSQVLGDDHPAALVTQARVLKARLAEAGVPWRKV